VSRATGPPRRSPTSPFRPLVRAAAVASLAAAIAVPLARRRLRLHPAASVAATALGPFAVVVLRPRTKGRDAALFALHMWAFAVAHELPYDDPERLRARLRVRYPIAIDRFLGAGELPNVRLQRAISRPGRVTRLDRILAVVHWAWFFEPHAALLWILLRDEDRFPRAARQLATAFDIGCAIYYALPTAPPWWAAEHGYIAEQEGTESEEIVAAAAPPRLRRVMVEVGEGTWGRAWPVLYSSLGGNPWAAMPSLHFATSLLAAILLSEAGTVPGVAGWAYAATLAVALTYLGEHYVVDLLAGAGVVLAVRRAEPIATALTDRTRSLAQRLETIANG
jgi:membrane-associated phospholipid phosphatase